MAGPGQQPVRSLGISRRTPGHEHPAPRKVGLGTEEPGVGLLAGRRRLGKLGLGRVVAAHDHQEVERPGRGQRPCTVVGAIRGDGKTEPVDVVAEDAGNVGMLDLIDVAEVAGRGREVATAWAVRPGRAAPWRSSAR